VVKVAGRKGGGRGGSGIQFAGSLGSFHLFLRAQRRTIRLCLVEARGGSAFPTPLLPLGHNFSFLDVAGRLKKL